MDVFNTLTRKTESFKPLHGPRVSFYQCGPTVYWTQHIGNMRAMVMGDLVVRVLRYLGYEVTFVRNYTDVGHLTSDSDTGEDKMAKGAAREGLSPQEIADKYIAQFEHDTQQLHCTPPDISARATGHIPEMIALVQTLLNKGYAYETDHAVYFSVEKFGIERYTRLSRQKMDELVEGAGKGEVRDEQKKHPADFVLWFFRTGAHAKALQYWQSPFHSSAVSNGEGFPGWHIECSAMSMKYLGETLDIHMGGVEHIPIHHSNEIAQSEGATGKPFVRYWLHNEHLLVNGQKMAKSQGTGLSLETVEKQRFHPLALRYFFLQARYRTRQNFTYSALEASQQALTSLIQEIWVLAQHSAGKKGTVLPDVQKRFAAFIAQDFNIPKAVAAVWEVVHIKAAPQDRLATLLDFDRVLGLGLHQWMPEALPREVQKLVDAREEYRSNKQFDKADEVRHQLQQAGYLLEDTNNETVVKPVSPLANTEESQ